MKITMDKKYKQRNGMPVRVLCVDGKNEKYPVIAEHQDGSVYHYSPEGHFASLSSSYDLIEDTPYADFKVDDKVMVRDEERDLWQRRYFSGIYADGRAMCFSDGCTSWSGSSYNKTPWTQCRKPTPEELA